MIAAARRDWARWRGPPSTTGCSFPRFSTRSVVHLSLPWTNLDPSPLPPHSVRAPRAKSRLTRPRIPATAAMAARLPSCRSQVCAPKHGASAAPPRLAPGLHNARLAASAQCHATVLVPDRRSAGASADNDGAAWTAGYSAHRRSPPPCSAASSLFQTAIFFALMLTCAA